MRLKSLFTAAVILLCAVLCISCGPPVTNINVDCSVPALIDAINTANDSPTTTTTLHLTPDCTYELTDILLYDTELYPSGVALPEIISPIIIDGQAATIRRSDASGTPNFRIFMINDVADLTINSIYLENGNVQDDNGNGGAILNYGSLTITLSDVFNNSAGRGGAIYNVGTFSTLWSVYYNNDALMMGGAVQSIGDMTLDRSIFFENNAYYGGAVANHMGDADVTGSHFNDNEARADNLENGFGGAISNTSSFTGNIGKMHVNLSTFGNNNAGYGGAIANKDRSEIMLRDCSFTENNAHHEGGACFNEEEMTIPRSTFSNNTASFYGGAIFFHDTDDAILGMTIGNSTFSGNQITGGTSTGGSAIYQSDGRLALGYVTVTENSGAIAIVKTGGITVIRNSIIANNTNGDCGGAAVGSISVDGEANLDSDGSCPAFTLTLDPRLYPLADNGGETQTHALRVNSPALDAATDTGMTVDQRQEPRPAGTANDLGSFESQVFVGPIVVSPMPQIVITVPVPEEPHKIPDYYWEFEGYVCSDIGLTEFYIKTSAAKDNFNLQVEGKPVACYQQSYDTERYWCHVEKQSVGWSVPAEVTFCAEEDCTTINRTTLAEMRCNAPDAPSEPEIVECAVYTTFEDCAAAPACSWVCADTVTAKLCNCENAN
ncbi:MAG: hypothetical protein JEZ00_01780 [Anaerolineaceae bacterium]|nr:hypothetical protein [Anaerolineaceae bacterium]